MEKIIRQYLAFFAKRGNKEAHPLMRGKGYMEELSRLSGMLISSPEHVYMNLRDEIERAYNWYCGCPMCDAKKECYQYLVYKYRDKEKALAAWSRYIKIQQSFISRWYPCQELRIFYHEVLNAMELWGNDAYMISPSGDIIPLEKTVKDTVLIDQPELFGFTRDELKGIYRKHDENYGMKRNAWVEIKDKLLSEGWVFANFDPNRDRLTVEIHKHDDSSRVHLRSLAEYLIGEKVYREDTRVKFVNSDDEVVKEIRLNSIS